MTSAQIERGIKVEKKEHPWMIAGAVRKLVQDHIKINPNEYKKR